MQWPDFYFPPVEESLSPAASFLKKQVFLYSLLVCLFCPVISSFGMHWGPRMLLMIIPSLLVLLGPFLSTVPSFSLTGITLQKGMNLSLILVNGLLQAFSLYLLYNKVTLNEAIYKQLSSRPEKVIVTSVPWFAEEMAPLYFQKIVFYCPDQSQLFRLIEILRKKGFRELLLINSTHTAGGADNFLSLPDAIRYFLLHAQAIKI